MDNMPTLDNESSLWCSIYLGVTTVLILTLNPLFLVVIRRVENIPTSTKIFLVSLTISDLGVGLFAVLPTTVMRIFNLSIIYIPLLSHLTSFSVTQSFISLLLLTIDRYLAIAWCLHYPRLMTTRRSRIIVVCSWVLLVIILATIAGLELSLDRFNFVLMYIHIYTFIGLVLLGLVIIVVLYIHILIIARRHQAQRNARENQFAAENNTPRRIQTKPFTTVILILIFVVVCWAPLPILSVLQVTVPDNSITLTMDQVARFTVFITSWADGIILYMRNRQFRKVIHKMVSNGFGTLRQKCKRRQTSNSAIQQA